MEKIKFGIIGVGNMGSAHMQLFFDGKIPNAEVCAIADIDESRLSICKKKFKGNYNCFSSADKLITSGSVDAVIIATPHYSHCDIAIMALQANLNVICEKPAGVYTKQVKQMNEEAIKSKKLFTVMFNQRTNPLYKKMREFVLNGSIGIIKRINWIITDWYRSQSYYDSSSWRATWTGEGGGVLINQCPHQLDLLQWITGLMPNKVRAFCHFGKWHNIEVEDDVTAYLEFTQGATGVFVTSTADCPGTNRLEILGSKGSLIIENDKLVCKILQTDEREFNSTYTNGFGTPKTEKSETYELDASNNPQHMGIINNFTNTLLCNESLFVDGTEGIKGVELMNAMLLSTWLDKTVTLPIDSELYLAELNKRVKNSKVKNAESKVLDVSATYGTKA